jgi:dienelactone hydrolase
MPRVDPSAGGPRAACRLARHAAIAGTLAAASLAGFAAPASAPGTAAAQTVSVPVHEASGPDLPMKVDFFLPPGPGPFPVVVFSHGRPHGRAGRVGVTQGVSRSQLDFWLAHGAAVVSPVRPGYGPGTTLDPEQSGARHDETGRCIGTPDFRKTADAASRTIAASLDWLRTQRWADGQHVLLVGQSVGGLATVAAAAQRPAGVVGYLNFAGGTGGNPETSPGRSCDPGQLERLYRDYGRTTVVPNLWVYARNDQYWGADAPVAWHAAFAKGGSRSTFVQAPAVEDGDGHGLSRHSGRLWASTLESWLGTVPFLPAAVAASASTSTPAR